MAGKITNFFREFTVIFSIITLIVGLILFLMGIIWYFFRDLPLDGFTDLINDLKDWNLYIFIIGFIFLITGIYYLYSYLKNKRFVLGELETNKRSELLKKHNDLKIAVRHLPSKYQKMLKDKEKELRIK